MQPAILWGILLFTLSGCSGPGATLAPDAPKTERVSDTLAITEIRPGVWVHTSYMDLGNGVIFPGNGLLVRDGDGLVMVDTAWGAEITAELLDWVDAEIGLPVERAVITHFHADSMGGMPALAERGIPAFAGPLTLELGVEEGVPLPQTLDGLQQGSAVTVGAVEVYSPGPGHSRDNLVVWVPKAKVLFGTCATRSPAYSGLGNTADADQAHWPQAIRNAKARYPEVEVVVPGHGPPGGPELLDHTIGLFE